MDSSVMALNEHFGNTGRTAKVTVNLKRRVCIEQVRISATVLSLFIGSGVQLFGYQFIGMVTIEQTRPQAHFPTP